MRIIGKNKIDWLLHLKKDVLSIAFSHARFSKGMEELTNFGMKISLTLPSLANILIVWEIKTMDLPTPIATKKCDILLGKVLKALDVQVSINIINLTFQMKYFKIFQKN